MRLTVLVLLLLAACSSPQQRMKDCNVEAGDRKGEERQAFMSACLKNPGVCTVLSICRVPNTPTQ